MSSIQWHEFSKFDVVGKVRGKGRPRFTKTGRTYTPKTTADYERQIKLEFLRKGPKKPTDKPVRVKVTCYYEVPKSARKADKIKMAANELLPTKKPDVDNILKAILDALNGLAYLDDKQVVQVGIIKKYSEIEGIKITIEEGEVKHDD